MSAGYGWLMLFIGLPVTFMFFVLWIKAMEWESKQSEQDARKRKEL